MTQAALAERGCRCSGSRTGCRSPACSPMTISGISCACSYPLPGKKPMRCAASPPCRAFLGTKFFPAHRLTLALSWDPPWGFGNGHGNGPPVSQGRAPYRALCRYDAQSRKGRICAAGRKRQLERRPHRLLSLMAAWAAREQTTPVQPEAGRPALGPSPYTDSNGDLWGSGAKPAPNHE